MSDSIEIEGTVVSGFESVAKDEVEKKLKTEVLETKIGRVNFLIDRKKVKNILNLRSVDNLYFVVKKFDKLPLTEDVNECLLMFRSLVSKVDWNEALNVWSIFFNDVIEKKLNEKCSSHLKSETESLNPNIDSLLLNNSSEVSLQNSKFKPSYRVTCKRNGNHSFQSPQVAHNFGGVINDLCKWTVDLSNFDLEVMVVVNDLDVRVCVALTTESLHRRNIINFGSTTLKPTIAFGMLWHCKIQPGDVVCDPLCGTGSIPIECAASQPFPHESNPLSSLPFNLCGDIGAKLVEQTRDNWSSFKKKFNNEGSVDIMRWNSCKLPLRNETVDVFISDLPFGKRVGSRISNWILYKGVLLELARVCRRSFGRACLLTQDRKCMINTLDKMTKYWKRGSTISINIGGLTAGVYLLYRTSTEFTVQVEQKQKEISKKSFDKNKEKKKETSLNSTEITSNNSMTAHKNDQITDLSNK